MNWIKVMNTLPAHPKILMAGDRAAWLYICGLCYSNEHLLDGRIARTLLPFVCPGSKSPDRLADRLVVAGLWEVTEDGWQIHDYADVQRTASEVKEIRRKDRERKALDSARKAGLESTRNPDGIQTDSNGSPGGPSRASRANRAQDKKREEKKEPPLTPPPAGGRRRSHLQWERDLDSWAAEMFPALDEAKRNYAVRQALKYGADSPEAVRAHIDKFFPHLAAALEAA